MSLTHRKYAGFLPFTIGNYDTLNSSQLAGNIIQLPLQSFCDIWWRSKTISYSISLSYAQKLPLPFYQQPVNDSGTVTGSGSGVKASFDTLTLAPRYRTVNQPIPFLNTRYFIPARIGSYISMPVVVAGTAYRAGYGPPLAEPYSRSDLGANFQIFSDGLSNPPLTAYKSLSTGLYYGTSTNAIVAAPWAIGGSNSVTIISSGVATGAVFNLTVNGATFSFPLYANAGTNLVSMSGSFNLTFDSFWTP